jgi:hypothetical protein
VLDELRLERESAGVVKLADILKQPAEDGDRPAAEEAPEEESAEGCGGEKTEEEEHPPQLEEALSVLADWVQLQS